MVAREIFLVTEMPMPDRPTSATPFLGHESKSARRAREKKGEMEQEGRVRLLAELDSVLPPRAKGRVRIAGPAGRRGEKEKPS